VSKNCGKKVGITVMTFESISIYCCSEINLVTKQEDKKNDNEENMSNQKLREDIITIIILLIFASCSWIN